MTERIFGQAIGDRGGDNSLPDCGKDPYHSLERILRAALLQAAEGKGRERHANGESFDDQPMQIINQLVGVGFSTGQAIKKIQESRRMKPAAAIHELLGAIVYTAGAILHLEAEAADQRQRAFEDLRKVGEGTERR